MSAGSRTSRRRSSKVDHVTRNYILEGSFFAFNNDGQTTMRFNINVFIAYKLFQEYINKPFGKVQYSALQTKYANYNIPNRNAVLTKAKKYLLNKLSDSELISLDIDEDLKQQWKNDINDTNNKKKSSKKSKSLVYFVFFFIFLFFFFFVFFVFGFLFFKLPQDIILFCSVFFCNSMSFIFILDQSRLCSHKILFIYFVLFFLFVIYFVESKSKKYTHNSDSSSSETETETESETQYETHSDSESDDDNEEYLPAGSVKTSGRKTGKKNFNKSTSKSKNKNKSKSKSPNKNKNKSKNKSKNPSKTNTTNDNDYPFGQSITKLNEILSEEIDVDGAEVNLQWHELVAISPADQITQFGKVLAKNNCYRPAGTRAEYKQDPLAIDNSYSEETNTYLKQATSSNINTNNKRGKKRRLGTPPQPQKKKQKLKHNSRSNKYFNNNNAKTSDNNIYKTGLSSCSIYLHLPINPNDKTDYYAFNMIHGIQLMINQKSNTNRFKFTSSAEETSLYYSSDKITTAIGGELNILVQLENVGRSVYPDQQLWDSDSDCSKKTGRYGSKIFEFPINMELYARNTTKENDKSTIVKFVDFLKKVGLRPYKFYYAALIDELLEIGKDVSKVNQSGIANSAFFLYKVCQFILIQTCLRDYCGEEDLQKKGAFRSEDENERLLYHFSIPDPSCGQNGGLTIVTDTNCSKLSTSMTLAQAVSIAQNFGTTKFSIYIDI